jgi:hypothetical protein
MADIVPLIQDYSRKTGGYIDLTAIPVPPQGGKIWLLERKGVFLLERGPGTLRTIACTGAGSGTLMLIDGVPEENGEVPLSEGGEPLWRTLYKAHPPVMGSWMLDGGFLRGLTLVNVGGQPTTSVLASIVWTPYRARVK